MPQNQSTDDILASAKKTLAQADTLSKSVAQPQTPAQTEHEYSTAPYSLVKKWADASKAPPKPKAETGMQKEARQTGESIKANMENARKALATQ